LDLQDLTVFVITSGEDTYDECLEALHSQDCNFKIDHIRDVAPMSKAFQTMPDRCQSRYFVQVDADIILHPHAICTLHQAIRQSSFRTYMVYGQLYEEGFGVGGAVKCWKRSIFRFFKFRDVRTVDRDLYRRLRLFGLRRYGLNELLGIHRPRYSDFSLYLKSKSDIEKWRFLKRPAAKYAIGSLEKMLQDYPDSRHRLLGALLGALTGPDRLVRSKNIPLETIRFQKALSFLGQDDKLSHVAELSDNHTNRCKEAFATCYEDYRGGDPKRRETLARLILEVFSQHSVKTTQIKEFLEIMQQ
jgi:hypothetical protein